MAAMRLVNVYAMPTVAKKHVGTEAWGERGLAGRWPVVTVLAVAVKIQIVAPANVAMPMAIAGDVERLAQ